MFIFTTYQSDWEAGTLTDKAKSRYELLDIEIISYQKSKKLSLSDYMFN